MYQELSGSVIAVLGFGSAIAKRSVGIAFWRFGGCDSEALRRNRLLRMWECDSEALRRNRCLGMLGCDSEALRRNRCLGMWGCDSEALRRNRCLVSNFITHLLINPVYFPISAENHDEHDEYTQLLPLPQDFEP